MENNNSKQVLFSIIGVAILIVAVVGVSFAFFTYSRTGTTNNFITTGKITFNFDDPTKNPSGQIDPDTGLPKNDTPLKVENGEPKTNPEAEKDFEDPNKKDEQYGFGIDATLPKGVEDVNYKVYVIPGDLPKDAQGSTLKKPAAVTNADGTEKDANPAEYTETDRMNYQYISIMVAADETARNSDAEKQGDYPTTGTGNVETRYAKGGDHSLAEDPKTANKGEGLLIASGTLKGGTEEGSSHTFHAYKISMWINDKVKVSDTDGTAPYRASRESSGIKPSGGSDGRPVYSDLFYSLKIKIVAGSEVGTGA